MFQVRSCGLSLAYRSISLCVHTIAVLISSRAQRPWCGRSRFIPRLTVLLRARDVFSISASAEFRFGGLKYRSQVRFRPDTRTRRSPCATELLMSDSMALSSILYPSQLFGYGFPYRTCNHAIEFHRSQYYYYLLPRRRRHRRIMHGTRKECPPHGSRRSFSTTISPIR